MRLPDFRCFAEVPRLEAGRVVLSEEESRHLGQVRRAGVGTEVMVLNGCGDRGVGEVAVCGKRGVEVEIVEVERVAAAVPRLTLWVGGLKQGGWDEVLRYAGELGVDGLVWVQSDHAVADVKRDRAEEKLRRWREKLVQALKQCGNAWMPALAVAGSVEESVGRAGAGAGRFVASLEGEPPPLAEGVRGCGGAEAVQVWIGPEGDFSEREYALLREAGVVAAGLGPRILRAETAVLAAAALVRLG